MVHTQIVVGSNPTSATKRLRHLTVRIAGFHLVHRGSNPLGVTNSDIAQLVEQMTVNHRVPGSSPGVGAIVVLVQLVRTLACHVRGHEFESRILRH